MKIKIALVLSYYLFVTATCTRKENINARFLLHPESKSKRIEYFIQYPKGVGVFPAIIFIHGHQEGSRPGGEAFVKWGVLNEFADKGLIAISVSQPGYGKSDGPPDYCGPSTVKAVLEVINNLKKDPLYSHKLIVQGISRGAIVAGLVATQEDEVKAAILISGLFDLDEYVNSSVKNSAKEGIIQVMRNEIGQDGKSLKTRSLINYTQYFKAPLLLLNGEKDERTDPDQARLFSKSINEKGGRAKLVMYKEYGHQIPPDQRNKVINPFIDSILKIK